MAHAFVMAAMPVQMQLQLLIKNGVGANPVALGRTIFLLQSGMWTSFLNLVENVSRGSQIRSTEVPSDPLIIVGHWRTGSTFLQNLLSTDPDFTTSNFLNCIYPGSFLSCHRFVAPIVRAVLPSHRPMDNVSVCIDEPHEDEDALFRLCGISPMELLLFQKDKEYFLKDADQWVPLQSKNQEWQRAITQFVKKLHMSEGKRVLLKNPFHSFRIPTLLKLFPNARFIHIYREPLRVIRSTQKMWEIMSRENALRGHSVKPSLQEVATVFDRMMKKLTKDLEELPNGRVSLIRYEELEKDPVGNIQRAYKELSQQFSSEFEMRLKVRSEQLKHYEKNTFTSDIEDITEIRKILDWYCRKYGYYIQAAL